MISGGIRAARRLNTGISDLASGKTFLRHASSGDDAAREIRELRLENARDRAERNALLGRIATALESHAESPVPERPGRGGQPDLF